MIKAKAVAVGALTVILAMLVVVVLAVPLDRFVASQLAGGTVSVENLFLLTYWPIRIFTWIGLFLAIALGSYVATRVSRSDSNIHWLIMVVALIGAIWAGYFWASNSDVSGPIISSIIAVASGAIGHRVARRRMQAAR
ncbi:MAG: hypothetical protein WBN09_05990 [Woeseiaceae bacterium]